MVNCVASFYFLFIFSASYICRKIRCDGNYKKYLVFESTKRSPISVNESCTNSRATSPASPLAVGSSARAIWSVQCGSVWIFHPIKRNRHHGPQLFAGAAPARDARARGPAPSGHPQPSCGHLWVRTGKLMLEHPCSLTTNRLDS